MYRPGLFFESMTDSNHTILTGDPEFKKVEHLVEIEWLNK